MVVVRKSKDRGHANHGWLDSYHSFSFASYHDPAHVGFRDLRVINEDRVQPGMGFGTHPHRDMEIISYVLEGDLAHEDSVGSTSILGRAGVQAMSAGRGVSHSEFNPSGEHLTHFFQVWILPREKGGDPAYAEKTFSEEEKRNRLRLLVSPDGAEDSLRIGQDVRLLASLLEAGKAASWALGKGRHAWVQVASGRVLVNGVALEAGDGAAIREAGTVRVHAGSASEFLLFDLR